MFPFLMTNVAPPIRLVLEKKLCYNKLINCQLAFESQHTFVNMRLFVSKIVTIRVKSSQNNYIYIYLLTNTFKYLKHAF